MNERDYILDPLWITKGSGELDREYLSYILLAADKRWRNQLSNNDASNFYEILFHMLNLNNLAIDGRLIDANMKPVFDNDKLDQIRESLQVIYSEPGEVVNIFKYTNTMFIGVMLDHLEVILDSYEDSKLYYSNRSLHRQNEIFIIVNTNNDNVYDIWNLKFDKRLRHNWSVTNLKSFKLDEIDEINSIDRIVNECNDPLFKKYDSNTNVILVLNSERDSHKKVAEAVVFTLLFDRMILKHETDFHPNILFQLRDLLKNERILPFTLDDWV